MNGRRAHKYLTFNAQLSPKVQVTIQHHLFETPFCQPIGIDIMNALPVKTAALIVQALEDIATNARKAGLAKIAKNSPRTNKTLKLYEEALFPPQQ